MMVIRRVYLERVRKKSFWIGVLVFPVIMAAMFILPMLLVRFQTDEERRIVCVDATGRLLEPLRKELADEKLKDGRPKYLLEAAEMKGSLEETRKGLEPRVGEGEIFGILTIGDELNAEGNYSFYGKNVGNIMAMKTVEGALEKAVVGLRMERMKLALDPGTLETLTAHIDLESLQVSAKGPTRKRGFSEAYIGTFAFVFILFMSMLLYGIAVMRGILEEKSNRIMEVLLGSLSPDQLMAGKILGIGLVGLTQLGVYAGTAIFIQLYVTGSRAEGGLALVLDALSPVKMIYFVVFFLLGYFMYTALFAAVGAVCNSEQEAQNLQAPLQWTLMIPMMATIYFVQNPDSKIAVVVSLIPLFTPMVMFMRISLLTPPFWQIALSILLSVGAIYLLFRGVAKVFRIGILMYGKRPTIPEILRWARS